MKRITTAFANLLSWHTTGSQTIDQLDLGPIKVKLMETEEGEGWTAEQANIIEKGYKMFLLLNQKYPSASIVPNKAIDTFWHYHILDTQKYAEDCQNVFGRFFHHFPYFGMRGPEDAADLKNAFGQTEELFVSEFGVSLGDIAEAFSSEGVVTSSHSANSAKCEAGNCRACKGSNPRSGLLERPVFAH